MGWWLTESGLEVGDGVLDAVESFLAEVRKEFRRDKRRLPTVEEVLAALACVLGPRAEEFVSGCETLEITEIVAKARKRPKKQKYAPGDVFKVPLSPLEFALGRVTPQYLEFAFFDSKWDRVPSLKRLREEKVFSPRYGVSDEALLSRRWPIVARLPYATGEFKVRPFLIAGQIACNERVGSDGFIHPDAKLRMATEQEMNDVPKNSLSWPEGVEDDLRKRFGIGP